jgi:hypothetical protein
MLKHVTVIMAVHVILMAFQHTTFTGLSIVSYGIRELSEYQIR